MGPRRCYLAVRLCSIGHINTKALVSQASHTARSDLSLRPLSPTSLSDLSPTASWPNATGGTARSSTSGDVCRVHYVDRLLHRLFERARKRRAPWSCATPAWAARRAVARRVASAQKVTIGHGSGETCCRTSTQPRMANNGIAPPSTSIGVALVEPAKLSMLSRSGTA